MGRDLLANLSVMANRDYSETKVLQFLAHLFVMPGLIGVIVMRAVDEHANARNGAALVIEVRLDHAPARLADTVRSRAGDALLCIDNRGTRARTKTPDRRSHTAICTVRPAIRPATCSTSRDLAAASRKSRIFWRSMQPMLKLVGIAEQAFVAGRSTFVFPFRQLFAGIRIEMAQFQRLASNFRNRRRLVNQPLPDADAAFCRFPQNYAPIIADRRSVRPRFPALRPRTRFGSRVESRMPE